MILTEEDLAERARPCKACKALIFWAYTRKGGGDPRDRGFTPGRTPFELEKRNASQGDPVYVLALADRSTGRLLLWRGGKGELPLATRARSGEGYVSHFRRCPEAQRFSRGNRRGRRKHENIRKDRRRAQGKLF